MVLLGWCTCGSSDRTAFSICKAGEDDLCSFLYPGADLPCALFLQVHYPKGAWFQRAKTGCAEWELLSAMSSCCLGSKLVFPLPHVLWKKVHSLLTLQECCAGA